MPVECPFASTVLSCFLLQPMLTSETEASGADAEDCTVHVLGETGQPGKGCSCALMSQRGCRACSALLFLNSEQFAKFSSYLPSNIPPFLTTSAFS